jgi:iron complex outermembrane receptor protein
LFWLLPAWPAAAQSAENADNLDTESLNDLSLAELLEVRVVTASGGAAEDRDLSSANVLVYTRRDILRHGWVSVAEVLAHVPGLYVIDDLVTPSVSVRGTSGGLKSPTRIIKVMINGVEVSFRPDMTAFLGPEYIPMDAVEQIEIARGPLSALYGANAYIATVNLITRRPAPKVHAGLGANLSAAGVRGHSQWMTLSYGSDRVSALVSVSDASMDRSGLEVQRTFARQDPASNTYRHFFTGDSQHDQAQPRSLYANLVLSRKHLGDLTLQAGVQRLDAHGEFQSFSALTHSSRYSIENYWYHARAERKWSDDVSSWVSAGWSQGAPTLDDLQYLSGTQQYAYHRNFAYRAFDGRAGVSLGILSWLSASADLDGSFEHHRVPYYTQIYRQSEASHQAGDEVDILPSGQSKFQDVANLAVHAQLAAQNLEGIRDLRILGDVRVDKSNLYPAEVSWRGAVGYRWTESVTTRLVGGRAFQAPSAMLLFANPGFGTNGNVVGNRSVPNQLPLRPQVLTSGEFILNLKLNEALEVGASVFGQQLERSINFVSNGLGYLAQNGPTRKFVGTELTTRLARGRYSSQLGVAYQKQLRSDVPDTTDDMSAPPLYPSFWVMSSLGLDIPEVFLQLTATARWVGQRGATEQNLRLNDGKPYTLPAYMRLDLGACTSGVKLVGEGETKVGMFVRNLTDERHSEPGPLGADLPTLGRTYELHARQEF